MAFVAKIVYSWSSTLMGLTLRRCTCLSTVCNLSTVLFKTAIDGQTQHAVVAEVRTAYLQNF